MHKKYLILLFVIVFPGLLFAQISERRRAYDSLIVGDLITPAVSSVMMPKSYTEVLWSNNLLTANAIFDGEHKSVDAPWRFSVAMSTLQVTHGISSSGRFNVGIDVNYRAGREDSDRSSSPLAVLGNKSDGLVQYERGITSIGIRARYVPIASKRNFVIQHVYYVPMSAGSEQSIFLGDNRKAFNTQFLYNQLLGRKMFLFGQIDALIRFKDDRYETDFINPVNLFATYLLNKHLFPFAQIGMMNAWNKDFKQQRQSFSYGLGLQYQFTTMFTINAFYNDTFAGKNTSQWKGYNLGVRVVL